MQGNYTPVEQNIHPRMTPGQRYKYMPEENKEIRCRIHQLYSTLRILKPQNLICFRNIQNPFIK
jgi:hypothetical protein